MGALTPLAIVSSSETEAIQLPAVALGGTTGAGGPGEGGYEMVRRRWWRAVIHQALAGDGGTDPLVDDADHLEHPLAAMHPSLDPIAGAYQRGRLALELICMSRRR